MDDQQKGKVIGMESGNVSTIHKTAVAGEGITDLKKAWSLKDMSVAILGSDILMEAYLKENHVYRTN